MINRSLLLLVLSSLLFGENGWGTTYYVDQAGGKDANPGTSTGKAWKTISKVNRSSFSAGDSILFKRGGTWKEILAPPSSGAHGNPITFGAYGSGNAPILTGRGTLTGWNNTSNWDHTDNVWSFSYSHNPGHLYLSNIKGWRAEKLAGVNSSNNWYWSIADNLIYVHSISNPASVFTKIECNVLQENIYIVNKDYITIRDLDLRNARDYIIFVRGSHGFTIDNNVAGYDASVFGIYISGYPGVHDYSDNAVVSNNTMNTNYGHIDTWRFVAPSDGIRIGSGVNGARIYNNTLTDWKHNGIYIYNYDNKYTSDNNWVYQNKITAPGVAYGRGFSADSTSASTTGNKFFRNIVRNTNIRNQFNTNYLEFYYNIIDNVTDSPVHPGNGQCFSLEGYNGTFATGMKIYNNVFANCSGWGIGLNGAGTNVSGNEIVNNIFYNNDAKDNYQIKIYYSSVVKGNTFKNNLLYKSGVTDLVYYGHDAANDYPHTVSEFNAENGTASDVISGNIVGDPLFIPTSDFQLKPGSPAINAGTNVGLTNDFAGNPVPKGDGPEIGVYEFQ